jgi:hypothetical protein
MILRMFSTSVSQILVRIAFLHESEMIFGDTIVHDRLLIEVFTKTRQCDHSWNWMFR